MTTYRLFHPPAELVRLRQAARKAAGVGAVAAPVGQFLPAYALVVVLAPAAATAIFRFNLGMLTVLGGSCAAGVVPRLVGVI